MLFNHHHNSIVVYSLKPAVNLRRGFQHDNLAFAIGAEGSFVSVSDSPLNGLQEFTISAWLNPTSFDTSRLGIVGQNDAIEFGFVEPNRLPLTENVAQLFLRIRLQCAQCHHHKFDPVSMEDYYRLHAVFAAIDRASSSA